MNALTQFLWRQIDQYGERLAVQSRPRYRTIRWSYADLGRQVESMTALLADRGVGEGDRVILFAENSPYWVAALFAIAARDAVAVPVNPKSPPGQIERLVQQSGPRLFLRSSRCPRSACALPEAIIDAPTNAQSAFPVDGRVPSSDRPRLAEILYTSGTTGDPKGVMLNDRNLLADLEAVNRAVPLATEDHVLSLVPLFHVYGQMTSVFCPLRSGCTVTYLAAPTSRSILEALAHTPATHLVAIPEVLKTMMDRLESRIQRIPGLLLPWLRGRIGSRISRTLSTIICGGAPLDPIVEEKWRALGFQVLQGYGLTETSPVIAANTPAAHRVGSVGRPLDGVEVKIAADGEVLVRGPIVTQGYYRDPARTEAAFQDGWFRTDDAGRFDEDGFLYVFGRRKYMILGPSGENVFPEDLEAELNRVPGVIDSAVVGMEQSGRTVIHAVLLCDPAQGEAVVSEANRHLAPHQQIMEWSVWPEADFPRSATRKVKKEDVIRWLGTRERVVASNGSQLTPLTRLLAEVTHAAPGSIAGTMRLVADLHVDSLLRIELVARMEEDLGIAIEESDIAPATTVADLEALLEKRKGLPPSLVRYPRWSLSSWAGWLRPIAQRLFLQGWIAPFAPLKVEGARNLDRVAEPVIFMANHRSYLDSAVATFALPARFRWRLGIAAATEVLYRQYRWAVPIGDLALNSFPFPTGVGENIRPGLDYIGRLLDDGWNVLIFPEGQMNRSGQVLQTLRAGTGVIAVEMGVPVVPLAITGTEAIMPPGGFLPKARRSVCVRFGPAISVDPDVGYREATARIEAALRDLLVNRSAGPEV